MLEARRGQVIFVKIYLTFIRWLSMKITLKNPGFWSVIPELVSPNVHAVGNTGNITPSIYSMFSAVF